MSGFLSGILDGIHGLATAPIKALEDFVGGASTKAKSSAKSAKTKAVETLTKKPAKVQAAKTQLATKADVVKKQPIKLIPRPAAPAQGPGIEQAIMMVWTFLKPLLDMIGERADDAITAVKGLSDHVEEVEAELLGRITYVESTVKSTVELIVHQRVKPLEDQLLAICIGFAKADMQQNNGVGLLSDTTWNTAFDACKSMPEFISVWMKYKKDTSGVWARLKAGAPAALVGVLATGALDSSMLSKSRNLRFEVLISAAVALLWGGAPPAWIGTGTAPAMMLLRNFFGTAVTMTANAEVQQATFVAGTGTDIAAKVTGVPDLLCVASDSVKIVEARLLSAMRSTRLDIINGDSHSGSDWSQGKTVNLRLPAARIVVGEDYTASRIQFVFRGNDPVGYASERIATTDPRAVPVA